MKCDEITQWETFPTSQWGEAFYNPGGVER